MITIEDITAYLDRTLSPPTPKVVTPASFVQLVEAFGHESVYTALRRLMAWVVVAGRGSEVEKVNNVNGWSHTVTTREVLTRVLVESPPLADLVCLTDAGLVVRPEVSVVEFNRLRDLWQPINAKGVRF